MSSSIDSQPAVRACRNTAAAQGLPAAIEPGELANAESALTGVTPAARFERKVKPVAGGCHAWTAYRTKDGYGQLWVDGGLVYAHRFAYEQARGPIPYGMQIDHICNVRFCVNVAHLQCVTPQQNNMLVGIRTGESEIYAWERALDEGLAVELSDLEPTGRLAQRAASRAMWLS